MSPLTAPESATKGQFTAARPRISRGVAMSLPKTLPMARPGNPVAASSMLTARSGSNVPRPTIAIPTGRGETRREPDRAVHYADPRPQAEAQRPARGEQRSCCLGQGIGSCREPGLLEEEFPGKNRRTEEPQNDPCIRPAEVPSRTAPVIQMGSLDRATGTRRPIAHDAVFAAALCAKRHRSCEVFRSSHPKTSATGGRTGACPQDDCGRGRPYPSDGQLNS